MRLPGPRRYAREWLANDDIWTLKFVKDLTYNGQENWGMTDPSTFEILILRGLPKGAILSTFIHELMHVIEWSFNLKECQKKKSFDPHSWIYEMDDCFAKVMIDNWASFGALFYNKRQTIKS